jgi:hypothetical protein
MIFIIIIFKKIWEKEDRLLKEEKKAETFWKDILFNLEHQVENKMDNRYNENKEKYEYISDTSCFRDRPYGGWVVCAWCVTLIHTTPCYVCNAARKERVHPEGEEENPLFLDFGGPLIWRR